jgi:hypothetical protein
MGYTVAEIPTVLHVARYGQSKARIARILLRTCASRRVCCGYE